MPRPFDQLRVLLIQIREREAVLAEERASFRERCRLRPDQLITTNALTAPLTPDLLDGVDAVLIGGAGAYSVTDTFPWTDSLIDLCLTCGDRRLPLFGSCWGHQFIARAFGGTVIHDPDAAELGTHAVELTPAGRADELLGAFPPRFYAQMGHHDRVSALPPGAVELATDATAPFQAFRIAGAPIYGTQFHSELNAAAERDRLFTYRAFYPELDDAEFEETVASLRETPEVDGLLHRFLMLYAAEPVTP